MAEPPLIRLGKIAQERDKALADLAAAPAEDPERTLSE